MWTKEKEDLGIKRGKKASAAASADADQKPAFSLDFDETVEINFGPICDVTTQDSKALSGQDGIKYFPHQPLFSANLSLSGYHSRYGLE